MEALKQAVDSNPSGRWWIKADAFDVRKGLRETTRGTWSGDEDLGDGSLQTLYADYKNRCLFVKKLATTESFKLIVRGMEKLLVDLEGDLEFLIAGTEAANGVYSRAILAGTSSEQKLMELSWSVVGFEKLVENGRNLQDELRTFMQGIGSANTGGLTSMLSSLLTYLKDLFSKKRIAATHVLVFMISDELRNRKPYALPVRFMPYKSLTDSKLRELEVQLEEAMRNAGMTVVGRLKKPNNFIRSLLAQSHNKPCLPKQFLRKPCFHLLLGLKIALREVKNNYVRMCG